MEKQGFLILNDSNQGPEWSTFIQYLNTRGANVTGNFNQYYGLHNTAGPVCYSPEDKMVSDYKIITLDQWLLNNKEFDL